MITPHDFVWTPASTARFWETYESSPGMELWHFSNQRGKALLRLVRGKAALVEPILDLGCGAGHLLDLLLKRGYRSLGADVNKKAITMITDRFGTHPLFSGGRILDNGAPLPFEKGTVGTVFLLETLEHLLPGTEDFLFQEIRRILVPEGLLVVTAPYREDLDGHMIFCPSCGARFHMMQHVKSLCETDVSAMIESAGLQVLSCRPELLLPEFAVWIRAQMTPDRKTVFCPECGVACASPNRSLAGRWKGLVKEIQHLVMIAKNKR
jgi:SAM-dependent methyltransferase